MDAQPRESGTKIGRYQKLLACQALLLRMLPGEGGMTVSEMNARLDEIIPEIRKRVPEFSFGAWARVGVFDCIAFMARCDLVSLTLGEGSRAKAERQAEVRHNAHTRRYLRTVESEAVSVLASMGI